MPGDSDAIDRPGAAEARTGNGKPSARGDKASTIKALFGVAKSVLCRKDHAEPQPRRRRRGETDKGFVAACRTMLRRAARSGPAARGRYAALRPAQEAFWPTGPYASAAAYLSDTLDWLTLWQDNADNDLWFDGDFSAKHYESFPHF